MEISVKSISNMKQAQLQQEVSNRVTRKTLDAMEVKGDQMLQMLDSVPKPTPSPTSSTGLTINTVA